MGEVPRPTLNKVRPLAKKHASRTHAKARKRAIIARGIEQEVEEVCSESANVAAIIVPFGPGRQSCADSCSCFAQARLHR